MGVQVRTLYAYMLVCGGGRREVNIRIYLHGYSPFILKQSLIGPDQLSRLASQRTLRIFFTLLSLLLSPVRDLQMYTAMPIFYPAVANPSSGPPTCTESLLPVQQLV